MPTMARNFGKQSIHDLVIRSVSPLWRSPASYSIEINPGSEKNFWAGSAANYPDLVGWGRKDGRNFLCWVAEVETEETITEQEAWRQWRSYAALGVPFYLIVPKGYKWSATIVAARAGVRVARIYEYSFENMAFQLV